MLPLLITVFLISSFTDTEQNPAYFDTACYDNADPSKTLVSGTSNLFFVKQISEEECIIHGTYSRVVTAYMTPAGEAVWHSAWMSEEDAKKLKDKKDVSLSPAYNSVIQHQDF